MSRATNIEKLKGLGIMIEGDDRQEITSGEDCELNIIAQFPDEGDDMLNTGWLRSLFLTCISRSNQSAISTNLIKSSVIFPNDIRKTFDEIDMIRIAYRLNLARELDRPLLKDSYYVQISARQYLSNTVQVVIG